MVSPQPSPSRRLTMNRRLIQRSQVYLGSSSLPHWTKNLMRTKCTEDCFNGIRVHWCIARSHYENKYQGLERRSTYRQDLDHLKLSTEETHSTQSDTLLSHWRIGWGEASKGNLKATLCHSFPKSFMLALCTIQVTNEAFLICSRISWMSKCTRKNLHRTFS